MSHSLEFSDLVKYDAGQPGVSLEVEISVSGSSVKLRAKIDTGSTNCIFARNYGEQLGLDIEDGELVKIGTATGTFVTYRHFVVLSFLDFRYDAAICFAADDSFSRNVLGRSWFLNQVILGLNDYEGSLYLNRLEEEHI